VNLPCPLLGPEGECTAYEARPAQCRKFHSVSLETCRASYAHPEDDSILTPEHGAVAHNAAVIIAQSRQAAEAAGLDAGEYDLNLALAEALANPKARRRWRDGKKAFVGDYRSAG
jgi:Fe-S-cluster containining protein